MGAEGSVVSDTAVGCLTAVVEESVGLPPKPQPVASPDERPTQKAATATIEQTGADPPPKG